MIILKWIEIINNKNYLMNTHGINLSRLIIIFIDIEMNGRSSFGIDR